MCLVPAGVVIEVNWWRRLSIAAKLPLGIGTLLLIVLGGMTAIVHAEVRSGLAELASERLDLATKQISGLLEASTSQRLEAVTELSSWPLLRKFLAGRETSQRAIVADTLRAMVIRGAVDDVEVWAAGGSRVIGTSAGLPPMSNVGARALIGLVSRAPAAVGSFERVGDAIFYSTIGRVQVGDRLLGYVVERARLSDSPEGVAYLRGMIGAGANLLLGNASGDVWTDLLGPAEPPPIDPRSTNGVVTYTRDGVAPVLARAQPVPSTPWVLVAELQRAAVFAPARRFLIRSAVLSLLLAAAGAAVGWVMSRRLSMPLQRVTAAAEAMAGGRAVTLVAVARQDEVGRLAASFNTMARQVQEGRLALEQRVADRTAALESANRELESFSYSVSHDLRAPLRAVDGFAAVLEEDHAGELSPEARRLLGLIRGSARQMGQLIDDLLTFSRLGRQPITRTTVDMHDLAQRVVEEACRAHGRDAGEFTIETLPAASGERSMLKQVFVNYVQNALKFTRPPADIRIGSRREPAAIVYCIRDNGVGFDMRYVDKLFGVFQRLHTEEAFPGTGVGLAVVKRVIERHGGRVWAEGALDQGATFYFSLPAD
jgi:signal transduction histidine kinase